MTPGRMLPALPLATAFVVAMLVAQIGFAQSGDAGTDQPQADARTAIISVVQAYHAALTAQDTSGAIALLAPDVMVLESGYIETAEEYVAHHLEADMEFSSATSGGHEVLRAVVEGDVGWVISSSTSKGEFRGHQVNSAGAEIMVLTRTGGEWKIRAIHWSSRKLSD